MNIHCLHGFLGSGKDFQFMKEEFPKNICHTPSLFTKNTGYIHPLTDFGREYNATVRLNGNSNILIGYSLGGRLAMHSLIEDETLYQAAVIVSAHTGLKNSAERDLRKQQDTALAKKLNQVPFSTFLEEWDSLPLFKGSPQMKREESDFEMEALQYALNEWSLGCQENLQSSVEALSIPILFVAGEKDKTYRDLALSLSLKNPRSQVWIAEETTHRVPWQTKERFVETVRQFIRESL